MSDDDQIRDEIEEIVNAEPVQEAAIETIIEEEVKPVKANPKQRQKQHLKSKQRKSQ